MPAVTYASGMMTCIRMQNLIKIIILCSSRGRMDRHTDSHSDYCAHLRVVRFLGEIRKLVCLSHGYTREADFTTLVNVYVDLLVFTRIAGTS